MAKNFRDPRTTIEFVEFLKRRWMATVDAIVDPLMLIDRDYEIIQTNRALADHSKTDVRDLIGKKCYQAFAKRDKPCPGCKIEQTMTSKKADQFELDEVFSGQYFEVTTQPIIDTEGNLEGALHIYRDRTVAKQLQNQLIQSEKLASIGLLAGGIAHEINNPLGGILIFSQMLLREMQPSDPHYQDVQEIESATQRCKSIVESLLDFARQQPNINHHHENSEEVDLRESLKSALKFGCVGGAADNIEIHEDIAEEAILVEGNRNKTIQIFLNLIQNALHAMPNGGKLFLRARLDKNEDKDLAVVEIQDTGIGIATEDLKRIFDPFYTSKAEGLGTGLGLSICHGIAEDMGGLIEVSSQVNHGSCFKFSVPALQKNRNSA